MAVSVLISSSSECKFSSVTKPSCRRLCRSRRTEKTPSKQLTICTLPNRQLHASCCGCARQNVSESSAQTLLGRPGKHTPQGHPSLAMLSALGLAAGTFLLSGAPAVAFTIHQEPDNALSLPTWIIHISSVIEWAIAMALVWKYADVTGNSKWKGLTWGMMPLLGGAICACTYHFFYNSSDLDFLVAIQASLTWIGNATCAAAAYRIYKSAQQEGAA